MNNTKITPQAELTGNSVKATIPGSRVPQVFDVVLEATGEIIFKSSRTTGKIDPRVGTLNYNSRGKSAKHLANAPQVQVDSDFIRSFVKAAALSDEARTKLMLGR